MYENILKNNKKDAFIISKKQSNSQINHILSNKSSDQYIEINHDRLQNTSLVNHTGIPNLLKTRFESISGILLDDVRIHYNSNEPSKIGSLAYTQGNQVYISSGQEKYLKHELGHILQQKQGFVQPTGYINGMPINDSPILEHQADQMPLKNTMQMRMFYNNQREPVIQAKKIKEEIHNKAYKDKVIKASDDKVANSTSSKEKNKIYQEDHNKTEWENNSERAKKSLENGQHIAFIINAILPYTEVDFIKRNVSAMIKGVGEIPVAVVLGINISEKDYKDKHDTYEKNLQIAADQIKDLEIPVAIVESTFVKSNSVKSTSKLNDFPYGKMRNDVLKSDATKLLRDYFYNKEGHYPYISIQDFDDASRYIPSYSLEPKHIFKAIDETLTGSNKVSEEYKKILESIPVDKLRELFPKNRDFYEKVNFYTSNRYNKYVEELDGYTLSYAIRKVASYINSPECVTQIINLINEKNDIKFIAEQVVESPATSIAQEQDEKKGMRPLLIGGGYRPQSVKHINDRLKKKGKKELSEEDEYKVFCKCILADMAKRDDDAKIAPLLPYVPEPNLFLDSFVALNNEVKFGDKSAEYKKLSLSLIDYQKKPGGYLSKLNKFLIKRYVAIYKIVQLLEEIYPDREAKLSKRLKDLLTSIEDLLAKLSNKEAKLSTSIEDLSKKIDELSDNEKSSLNRNYNLSNNQLTDNRDSSRGRLFLTKFSDLSIETDLSRLAEVLGCKAIPQTHDLQQMINLVFLLKEHKKDLKINQLKTLKNNPNLLKFYESTSDDEKESIHFLKCIFGAKIATVQQRLTDQDSLEDLSKAIKKKIEGFKILSEESVFGSDMPLSPVIPMNLGYEETSLSDNYKNKRWLFEAWIVLNAYKYSKTVNSIMSQLSKKTENKELDERTKESMGGRSPAKRRRKNIKGGLPIKRRKKNNLSALTEGKKNLSTDNENTVSINESMFSKQPILGDGNCLINSILTSANINNRSVQEIRNLAATRLQSHLDEYNDFISLKGDDLQKQINLLKQDRHWDSELGDLMPCLLADVLNLNIIVIQQRMQEQRFGSSNNPEVYILYNGRDHYDSLFRRQT